MFQGAFWSLMTGLVIGLLRFGLEFGYSIPPCGSTEVDQRPKAIKELVGKIHYLHFGILLFAFCTIVAIVVSLFTEKIDSKHVSNNDQKLINSCEELKKPFLLLSPSDQLHRLTFWTRNSREVRVEIDDTSASRSQSPEQWTDKVTTISDGGDLKSIPTPISGSIMPLATGQIRHFHLLCLS